MESLKDNSTKMINHDGDSFSMVQVFTGLMTMKLEAIENIMNNKKTSTIAFLCLVLFSAILSVQIAFFVQPTANIIFQFFIGGFLFILLIFPSLLLATYVIFPLILNLVNRTMIEEKIETSMAATMFGLALIALGVPIVTDFVFTALKNLLSVQILSDFLNIIQLLMTLLSIGWFFGMLIQGHRGVTKLKLSSSITIVCFTLLLSIIPITLLPLYVLSTYYNTIFLGMTIVLIILLLIG